MIAIEQGSATWDYQIGKWFARVAGVDMFFDTLESMTATLSLTADNIADLTAYKEHCEVVNGGSN